MQSGRNRVSKQLSSTPWHLLIVDYLVNWHNYYELGAPLAKAVTALSVWYVDKHRSRNMQSEALAGHDFVWAGCARSGSNYTCSPALPHGLVCAVAQAC